MIKPSLMTRRDTIGLGLGAALAGLSRPWPARAAAKPTVIVELFTSQGCSSCPAADAFMKDLIGDPGVLALSYSVDYWDYLGWKDTLANPDFSQRQYDYAKSRGDMSVYTPQMIVNGQSHFVGSHKSSVLEGIASAGAAQGDTIVPLALKASAGEVEITAGAAAGLPHGTLWLACVAPAVTVKIERGENAGREVVYHNVVRRMTAAGMWKGEALTIKLPKASIMAKGVKTLVALLQDGSTGPIRGSAVLKT